MAYGLQIFDGTDTLILDEDSRVGRLTYQGVLQGQYSGSALTTSVTQNVTGLDTSDSFTFIDDYTTSVGIDAYTITISSGSFTINFSRTSGTIPNAYTSYVLVIIINTG